MANTDKNSYTIIFAIVMVLVVGALLAFTASSLKPTITENERFEKQQNILMQWASMRMWKVEFYTYRRS